MLLGIVVCMVVTWAGSCEYWLVQLVTSIGNATLHCLDKDGKK